MQQPELLKLLDKKFRVMIPAEEINCAVSRVAEALNRDYADRPVPLFVGVLNGSFMFMSDLMKKIDFECELSFVKMSSYEGTSTTGRVRDLIGLNCNIEGRDIIIVEDIVDTGGSITHMRKILAERNPASIEVCTLFYKPDSYRGADPVRYRALEIGNEFIVGYGLDYNQRGRNLKDVYVVCDDER